MLSLAVTNAQSLKLKIKVGAKDGWRLRKFFEHMITIATDKDILTVLHRQDEIAMPPKCIAGCCFNVFLRQRHQILRGVYFLAYQFFPRFLEWHWHWHNLILCGHDNFVHLATFCAVAIDHAPCANCVNPVSTI